MLRYFCLLLTVICLAVPGHCLAQSVTVKINYNWYGEAIDTGEQVGPVKWSFAGSLSDGGRVQDSYEGRAGRLSEAGGSQEKLGGPRWQVAGPHQLRRVINWPNSSTIITVTVQGTSCDARVEAHLKPGKTFFLFRSISSGGMRAYRNVRYSVIDCTIG